MPQTTLTTCKWCEQDAKRTVSDYVVRDSAGVTTRPCVAHVEQAIFTALVMADEVSIKKAPR
jgi:hypothetical protein